MNVLFPLNQTNWLNHHLNKYITTKGKLYNFNISHNYKGSIDIQNLTSKTKTTGMLL
jgi:hypothetical protein